MRNIAIFRHLTNSFKKYPLLGNSIIYAGLYGSADVSRQKISSSTKTDWISARNMSLVGGGLFGPLYHYWYGFLDRLLPGNATKIILRKLFVDQILFGPPCIFLFFTAISVLELKKEITRSAKDKGPLAFATGCIYWPMAQSLNFYAVPSQFRAVYVACASFIWTNVMSYFKSM